MFVSPVHRLSLSSEAHVVSALTGGLSQRNASVGRSLRQLTPLHSLVAWCSDLQVLTEPPCFLEEQNKGEAMIFAKAFVF